MDLEIHQHVSKSLFEIAFRKFFRNDGIKIVECSREAAVPPGVNFASDLYRALVTYRTGDDDKNRLRSLSVIVKSFPRTKEAQRQQFVMDTYLFEKESEMYTKTIPAMHRILGTAWDFSAKFFHYTEIPEKMFVFEDLSASGYKMLDRLKGLDLDHCLLIVKKMARLHAASFVLFEKDPSSLQMYTNGIFSNDHMISEWMLASCKAIGRACRNWSGYEVYADKFEALEDSFVSKCMQSCQRRLGAFNVLNHGDAWTNNFMFSYAPNGRVTDFKFVDYQMVVLNSPVLDLLYFWATSPTAQVQRKHLQTFLDCYHAQLLKTLLKCGHSIDRVPDRKQLRKEWESRCFYGLVAAVTVLPLVKAFTTNTRLEEVIGEGDEDSGFRNYVYENETYKEHIQYLLPFFDELGAFDLA